MDIREFKGTVYEVVNSCRHSRVNIDQATRTIRCMICFELLDPFDAAMNYMVALDGYKAELDEYRAELDEYREFLVREKARNDLLTRQIDSQKRTKGNYWRMD